MIAVAAPGRAATPSPLPSPSPSVAPSPAPSPPPADNSGRLYVLDGWGGITPAGSAPALAPSAYWPNWDIARALAILPAGGGAYVLDGWGALHAAGSAPPMSVSAYWPRWDIARGLALLPSGAGGYVLDGWGGLHAFGSAPALTASAYWPNWDIARGIATLPDGSGGYVLDGWGGIHHFGTAPPVSPSAYWPHWDIARGIVLLPGSTASDVAGYTVDGWGGLHPFGSAPAVGGEAYWPQWDIVRGVIPWTAAPAGRPGGWTLDGWGGIHAFGSAPAVQPGAYWSGWDIARGMAGGAQGSGIRSVVTGGVIQNVHYWQQQLPLDCEAASLQMALGHDGVQPSQVTVLDAMSIDSRAGYYDYYGTLHWGDAYSNFVGNPNGSEVDLTGYGTYWPNVARVASALGGNVLAAGTGIRPSQLYTAVLAGHPAVAWVTADWTQRSTTDWIAWDGRRVPWAGPREHTIAVVGVSASSVYLYNPVSGPQWVAKSVFEAAYATYADMAVITS